jgi:hypothetical protein
MTHPPADTTADPTDDPTGDRTADSSGDLLDEEWLAAPTRRSRLRGVLVVLLAAALVFLAGVEVQRHFGATSSSDSAVAGAFPGGGLPTGFPAAGGPQGNQPDTSASSGSSGSGDDAAVIGTVESVKGDVWTIKDLGGTLHEVTVSSTVRIVRETSVDPAEVETGATVDVAGTTGDDGRVTALTTSHLFEHCMRTIKENP